MMSHFMMMLMLILILNTLLLLIAQKDKFFLEDNYGRVVKF
jgi:hypothetical protein